MATARYRYVQELTDRHGHIRLYYRRNGFPRATLRGPVGSAEFIADYEAAATQTPVAKSGPTRGTWRWLCCAYFASTDYKTLDERTQRVRRRILELTWNEPAPNNTSVLYSECPVLRLDARLIRVLRDRKASVPESANSRLKAIRAVFTWACEADHVSSNPGREVKFLRSKRIGGFHAWNDAEIAKFEERHPIGTKARLAFALLLYTGQRRSDVVVFGRQHVKAGWLHFVQHKNRNRFPVTLQLPILPELQSVLDQSPTGDLTFLVSAFGKPFTHGGFGNWFSDRCREAGLSDCSAHGLRKASARRLAEWGATTEQIKAWCGWRTAKEADRYLREVNQRKLAGSVVTLVAKSKNGTKV
ncbi:Integrase [Hyphomicrobium sp. 1Nfss2.1]|uniref:tyrosine-type recombinase/integrase n=1 Tax=Hyphomicrobium sp. 1Nfss2.1 TaxID=3413936 RepID=UPI003C7B7E0B